jgi:hypothetical protein
MTGIDLFLWSMPQHRCRALVQCAHPARHVGWKNLVQLGQGGYGRFLQASDGAIDGTPQTNDDGSRFIVIEEQRREAAAATELVPAESAGHRLNRIPQVTEPLHIATNRSFGDTEPNREFFAAPGSACLE